MSAPMRLKIINSLCEEEKNVGQLLDEIDTGATPTAKRVNSKVEALDKINRC